MQYKKTIISFVVLLFLSVEGASCFFNQLMSKQEWCRAKREMNAACDACGQTLNEALLKDDFDGAQEALSALQEMMNPLLEKRPSESVQQIAAEEKLQELNKQYQAAVYERAQVLEEGIGEMLARGRLEEADNALNALHDFMLNHNARAPQFEVLDAKYKKYARAYAADWRGMDQFDGVEEILRRRFQSLVKTFARAFNPPPICSMRGSDEVKALNASAYQAQERARTNRWLQERKVENDEYDPIEALKSRTRRDNEPTQEEIAAAGRRWVDEVYDYEAALGAKAFVILNRCNFSQEAQALQAQALLARTASWSAWAAMRAVLEERSRTTRKALGGEEPQHSTNPQFFKVTRPAKDGYKVDPEEFKQACEARQKALVALRNATRTTKPDGRDHLVEECRAFGKEHGLETGDSMAQRWLW